MENYTMKPSAVQTFPVDGGTDIILRRNIMETSVDDGSTMWECEERQFRYKGVISVEEIENDFYKWWNNADCQDAQQTPEERIAALEEALNMILEGTTE